MIEVFAPLTWLIRVYIVLFAAIVLYGVGEIAFWWLVDWLNGGRRP